MSAKRQKSGEVLAPHPFSPAPDLLPSVPFFLHHHPLVLLWACLVSLPTCLNLPLSFYFLLTQPSIMLLLDFPPSSYHHISWRSNSVLPNWLHAQSFLLPLQSGFPSHSSSRTALTGHQRLPGGQVYWPVISSSQWPLCSMWDCWLLSTLLFGFPIFVFFSWVFSSFLFHCFDDLALTSSLVLTSYFCIPSPSPLIYSRCLRQQDRGEDLPIQTCRLNSPF